MSEKTEEIKERFDKETKDHQITVIKDDGVYRHLRFKRPENIYSSFDIITWPGHLCYTGDMGSYLFTRITDMFEFFRQDPKLERGINPGYWSEKCVAHDRDGTHEFDADDAIQYIRQYMDDVDADNEDDVVFTEEIRDMVEDEIISNADDGETRFRDAVDGFTNDDNNNSYFPDFWESNLQTYTHRYIWCCYALVWGIEKYDALKKAEV